MKNNRHDKHGRVLGILRVGVHYPGAHAPPIEAATVDMIMVCRLIHITGYNFKALQGLQNCPISKEKLYCRNGPDGKVFVQIIGIGQVVCIV